MRKTIFLALILIFSVLVNAENTYENRLDAQDVNETSGRDSLITFWKMTDEIEVSDVYSMEHIPNKNEILICQSGDQTYEPKNYIYSLNTLSKVLDVDFECGSDIFISPNFILHLQDADASGNYGYYDVYETNNYQKVRTITFFGEQNLKADHIVISDNGDFIYAYEDSLYKLIKFNTSSWSVEQTKDIRFEGKKFTLSDDLILSSYKKYPAGNYYSTCGYRTLSASTLNIVMSVALDNTESGIFGDSCDIGIDSVNIVGEYFLERTESTFSLRNKTTNMYKSVNVQLGIHEENYMGYYSFDANNGLIFLFNVDNEDNRSEHLLLWRNVISLIENGSQTVIPEPEVEFVERIEYENSDSKPSCIGSLFGASSNCIQPFKDDVFFIMSWNSIYVYEQKVGYDGDGDNIVNVEDNCPSNSNPEQNDFDSDGQGDLCDQDDDNDGLLDELDNCSTGILNWNSNIYIDYDGDGCLDALEDLDDDNDGVADIDDGCPYDSNYSTKPEQGCGNIPIEPTPNQTGPQNDLPTEVENDIDNAIDTSSGIISKIIPYVSFLTNLILVTYIIRLKINSKLGNNNSQVQLNSEKIDYSDDYSAREYVNVNLSGGINNLEKEVAPVVEAPVAQAPPIPAEGLPKGWSMEQWNAYGQMWLEQNGRV